MNICRARRGHEGFELFHSKKDYNSICSLSHNLMAGVEGFEPPNAGTRTQCLTTWRHPIGA